MNASSENNLPLKAKTSLQLVTYVYFFRRGIFFVTVSLLKLLVSTFQETFVFLPTNSITFSTTTLIVLKPYSANEVNMVNS
jgi:hypothetical protein